MSDYFRLMVARDAMIASMKVILAEGERIKNKTIVDEAHKWVEVEHVKNHWGDPADEMRVRAAHGAADRSKPTAA